MKTILCGYCEQEVDMANRYWHNSKGKWYPLYLHNSCGVKVFEQGEANQIWKYHTVGRKRTDVAVSKEAEQAEHKQQQFSL